MKKTKKGLLLVGVLTVAIGISGLFDSTDKIDKDLKVQDLKAYNHSAENAIENVFIQNNNLILPFIFDNANQVATLDIRNEFAKAGLTVTNIVPETVGTGTQITVRENSNVYNVLIYGDVNGDGIVNLIDVQRIILHYSNSNKLTGLNAIAANVSNADNDDINLIDAQRVILFYLGELDTSLVVKEPESIIETDYISDVTITYPHKNIYNVGEELDLTGGKINIIYASGKIEPIEIQESMISGYNKDVPGEQTVTVFYKVNDTTDFTANFKVLVKKELTSIIQKPSDTIMTKGKCYETLEIALLTSGENEENININDLKLEIKKITNGVEEIITDENIAKVTKKSLSDGTIIVSFWAKDSGSYKITPTVNNIQGYPIKIVIEEDKTVNKITIGSAEFKQGTKTDLEIHFWHKYTENDIREVKKVDMAKAEVEALSNNNIDINFLSEAGYVINKETSTDTIINKISIKSYETGDNLAFSIKVGNYTETFEIAVTPIDLFVKGGDRYTVEDGKEYITLYKKTQGKEYNYTLIPIYKLDADGNEVRVKVKDIYQLQENTGNISILDDARNNGVGGTVDSINIQPFDVGKNMIKSPTQNDVNYTNSDIYYIGIALEPWARDVDYIEVSYLGQEITKLYVKVGE